MIQFNRQLSIGNILTAMVLLGTITGGVVTSYGRLNDHELRLTAAERALIDVHRVAEAEMRISALERALIDVRKDQTDYQTEMRGSVAKVVDILTDVRIQIGKAAPPPLTPPPYHAK